MNTQTEITPRYCPGNQAVNKYDVKIMKENDSIINLYKASHTHTHVNP